MLLTAVLCFAYTQLLGDVWLGWNFKVRDAASANLWAYPEQLDQFHDAVEATAGEPTLLMTNGYLPNLPPNIHLPDAWFPEPGIPTRSEIARVRVQASNCRYVILWWEYRTFDLWNSKEFSDIRSRFAKAHENSRFVVLRSLSFDAGAARKSQQKSP